MKYLSKELPLLFDKRWWDLQAVHFDTEVFTQPQKSRGSTQASLPHLKHIFKATWNIRNTFLQKEDTMTVFLLDKKHQLCTEGCITESVLTWNSFMYCAITNSCLSFGEGSANTSGRLFEAWLFLWAAVPFRWQSKPILPGNWNLWSWGPNGPITSSGHTVLGPVKVKALL